MSDEFVPEVVISPTEIEELSEDADSPPNEPAVNELEQELVVTQTRNTSPVKFVMKDGKEFKGYLKELEGDDREKFIDMQATRVQFDNKGRPIGLKPLLGVDQWLIIRCLVFDEKGGLPIISTKGEAQAKKFLAQFGGAFQGEMAKRIRQLSGIAEGFDEDSQKKTRDAAKNV